MPEFQAEHTSTAQSKPPAPAGLRLTAMAIITWTHATQEVQGSAQLIDEHAPSDARVPRARVEMRVTVGGQPITGWIHSDRGAVVEDLRWPVGTPPGPVVVEARAPQYMLQVTCVCDPTTDRTR